MSNSKHKTGRKPLKLGTVEIINHHWYLLIWLVYLTLFAIAEHVVTDITGSPICRWMTRSPSAAISSSPTACGIRCCF